MSTTTDDRQVALWTAVWTRSADERELLWTAPVDGCEFDLWIAGRARLTWPNVSTACG
jgi:hypothetical protein